MATTRTADAYTTANTAEFFLLHTFQRHGGQMKAAHLNTEEVATADKLVGEGLLQVLAGGAVYATA